MGTGKGSALIALQASLGKPPLSEFPVGKQKKVDKSLDAIDVDAEEDFAAHPEWGPQANDPVGALMLAAAGLIQRGQSESAPKKKKKKKRIFGLEHLPVGGDGSESSGSEGAPAGGSGGLMRARQLMASMQEEPKAFNTEMRSRLMAHLARGADSEHLLVEYVTQLPLEKQRFLGYFVWTMAQLNRELCAGRVEAAQLLTIRMVASIEQSLLDGHWRSAWPLSGLAEPPWTAWERTSCSAHRRAFTASPLLAESWVSAAIGRTRDETYLRKQRHDGKDHEGAQKGDQKGGGK